MPKPFSLKNSWGIIQPIVGRIRGFIPFPRVFALRDWSSNSLTTISQCIALTITPRGQPLWSFHSPDKTVVTKRELLHPRKKQIFHCWYFWLILTVSQSVVGLFQDKKLGNCVLCMFRFIAFDGVQDALVYKTHPNFSWTNQEKTKQNKTKYSY